MKKPETATQPLAPPESTPGPYAKQAAARFYCDRCGAAMIEDRCKIVCLNCGSRFDCSDLNLFFD